MHTSHYLMCTLFLARSGEKHCVPKKSRCDVCLYFSKMPSGFVSVFTASLFHWEQSSVWCSHDSRRYFIIIIVILNTNNYLIIFVFVV